MAVSDYAQMAVDLNGRSATTYTFTNGVTVEFYKSWVYVFDSPEQIGHGYTMQVNEGKFTYRGIEFTVVPTSGQRGCMAVISGGYGDGLEGVAGIAVHGYPNPRLLGWWEGGYCGIAHSTAKRFNRLLRRKRLRQLGYMSGHPRVLGRPLHDWIGLIPITFWIRWPVYYYGPAGPFSHAPDQFKNMDWAALGYSNQGDRFFADNVEGAATAPIMVPGTKAKPILHKLMGI